MAKPQARTQVDDALALKRQARETRKHLKDLSGAVSRFLDGLDQVMARPGAAKELAKDIGTLASALTFANDRAQHFGLDIDLRTGKRRKR